MHVHADGHLEEELEHHAVHVGRGQHGHHVHARLEHGAGVLGGELNVGVQGPVRKHHALGETGSAGSIVDDGQFIGRILIVIEVLRLKVVGIALAEFLVQVLPDIGQLLGGGIKELEGVDLHHHQQVRHLVRRKAFPNYLVHKQDTGFRMVHQVMDVARLEFVQDGYCHGAIGNGRQETHAPVGLVAGADGHLVPLLETALLKGNVDLGHPARYIPVGQGHPLIVGECRAVPVGRQAILENFVYRFEFHGIWIGFSSILYPGCGRHNTPRLHPFPWA